MISELGNHLWQSSTLFTCVAAFLAFVLRRNAATVRYWLWLAASAKFLIPLGVIAAVGSRVEWPTARVNAHQLVAPARIAVMEQISEPFAAPPPARLLTVRAANMTVRARYPRANLLFGIWLCGFVAQCAAWGRRWRRLRAPLRSANPAPIDLQKCEARIKIVWAPGQQEPGILGIFKPVLLLPEGIEEHLTGPQFRAILAHELAHVRRRDNLAAAFHMVVESLFWFHPAMWLIQRRLIEERERACDEEVLAQGIDPQDYCEGILNVCRLYLATSLACVSSVTGGDLRRRLEGIMTHEGAEALNLARKLVLAGAGLLAVVAPIVVGILHSPKVSAQATSPAIPAEWQSLIGTWQGVLQQSSSSGEFRVVVKITSSERGSLTAMLYAIDKPGAPLPASTVIVRGPALKMSFPGMIATYEGTLGPGGNSITGTWSQGSPSPLKLTRARAETAWLIPAPLDAPKPMDPQIDPAFEVATVKPSGPDQRGRSIHVQGRRLSTTETTLSYLIAWAYGIHARQIAGAPEWAEADKYDLTGEAENEGQPSEQQWKVMVRKLLADRFRLAFHREQKELAVYLLTAEKTEQKLTKSVGDPDRLAGMGFRGRPGAFFAHNANMTDFAGFIQSAIVDRPVINKTDIPGRFDFVLDWTPDDFELARLGAERPSSPDTVANPDLFTAMRQQLGLRLESSRAPAEVYVIDHVERPSGN